jgi:gentisate 1,2-dioxygenase
MSHIKAYEYESSVNPNLNPIPIISKNVNELDYGFHIIDISDIYNMDFPCTSPNLLASFIKLKSNNHLLLEKENPKILNASSHFFYILSGDCNINFGNNYNVLSGEILVIPCSKSILIKNNTEDDLIIYYINDSPLINYLGCETSKPIFTPSHYSREFIQDNLKKLSNPNNNRKGILLGSEDTEKIGNKTITPVLWSLYNELPPNTNQRIHKHNSVALDLCITCEDPKSVFTLVGSELDENGKIINPRKVYWNEGMMFITPPGLWHSHHNLSNTCAYILPIQDAGLLLYQRILGIDFNNYISK